MSDEPKIPGFDAAASEEARDEALERVDDHADPVWKREALDATRYICEIRAEFTADAVLARLHQVGTASTHDLRALGPVLRRAKALGLCTPTQEFRKTIRKSRHRTDIRVWKSSVFKPVDSEIQPPPVAAAPAFERTIDVLVDMAGRPRINHCVIKLGNQFLADLRSLPAILTGWTTIEAQAAILDSEQALKVIDRCGLSGAVVVKLVDY